MNPWEHERERDSIADSFLRGYAQGTIGAVLGVIVLLILDGILQTLGVGGAR